MSLGWWWALVADKCAGRRPSCFTLSMRGDDPTVVTPRLHPHHRLWRQELLHSTATGVPPATAAELQAAFRRCATTVWAARGAQAVPLASCAKHTPQHRQRCTLLKQFAANPGECFRGMVCLWGVLRSSALQLMLSGTFHLPTAAASLGSGAHAWLHRPFDCRELRAGPLEELGATV